MLLTTNRQTDKHDQIHDLACTVSLTPALMVIIFIAESATISEFTELDHDERN